MVFDTLYRPLDHCFFRHIFLAFEQCREADDRSLGLLFHAYCDEIRHVIYIEDLKRIIDVAAAEILSKKLATAYLYNALSKVMIIKMIQCFDLTGSLCQISQSIPFNRNSESRVSKKNTILVPDRLEWVCPPTLK